MRQTHIFLSTTKQSSEVSMNRREVLARAAVLSSVMISGISFADEKKSEKAATVGKDKLKKVTDAAFDCLKKGEACTSHCLDMIAAGDTSMKNCLSPLANMMAACTAISKIASYDTAKPEVIKNLALACADLCKDCSDACKVHAGHHPVCKNCMEACDKCAEACTALTA
jgi:Cys-rich four helix bundle protein (predicted Tat secretion target)